MWQSIRAARSTSVGQSLLSVTIQIEGAVHECTSQEDVEIGIMEMCKK